MSLDVDFDSVVTRFERSWEEHLASNCDVPRIDDFLPSAKHLRDSVLLELSTIDLERRLRFDKQGRVEDYLQSYPEMRKDPDAIGQLIKTEFEFRLRDEPGLNIQEYSGRFPVEFSSIKAELETLQLEALGPSRRTVGEYELVQQLGAGTMGRVYKAYQRRLDRIVAIKMIRSGKLASQHEKDRFQVEIKAAAGLDHPFIVRILEAGEHQDDLFFAMDYVDGTSLSELAQANPLEPRHAAKYVAQIAEGIEYAHQQNVLHRDLKPANILVDERDTIRIADFGLAKRLEADTRFTRTGDVLGTPSYMAPEQAKAQADAIDSRSDVYSIGAVAYELLTGRPPFQAATVWATLRQVVSSDPVPPRALNGDVPVELETICLKCLEKKPAHRFQSAAELRAELDRFINDERIVSRRPGLLLARRGLRIRTKRAGSPSRS